MAALGADLVTKKKNMSLNLDRSSYSKMQKKS